jgi:tetratricopeptide (TPR) repeat protein
LHALKRFTIIAVMLSLAHPFSRLRRLVIAANRNRWAPVFAARLAGVLFLILAPVVQVQAQSVSAAQGQTCPDLSAFYSPQNPNWFEQERQLSALMTQCLETAQFFALIGAAQLNGGQFAQAAESLERALLLSPENGAAQIDYAETLFEIGQLFNALELNAQLLQRSDLPAGLRPLLAQRQRRWQGATRELRVEADLLAGYDNNLNGGPNSAQIALTPSGESILLALSDKLRPVSGPYLNMGVNGRYRQLAAEHQHNWSAGVRGRVSEDPESDMLQLAGQYVFLRAGRHRSWQLATNVNHLYYGGSPLFSGIETSARVQFSNTRRCQPYYGLAVQQQIFHGQSLLNALESKLGAGISCSPKAAAGYQLTAELNVLNNSAQHSNRLGGSRDGWQASVGWGRPFLRGTLRAQLNYTELRDQEGYNPLLANGAERWQKRGSVLLQYSEPMILFGRATNLLVNIYNQRQTSNIQLFRTANISAEVGFSWGF